MNTWKRWLGTGIFFSLLSACSLTPPTGLQVLTPEQTQQVAFTDDQDFVGLQEAALRSLEYYGRLPDTRTFAYGDLTYSAREMEASTQHLLDLLTQYQGAALEAQIQQDFWFFESRNENGRAFFTGYYEPVLPGSMTATERFTAPLFAKPEDLVEADLGAFADDLKGRTLRGKLEGTRLVPYDDRQQIVYEGSLAERAEPLAFLENDIEVFFLQIQGSGLVQLDNGTLLRLNYAGQNGHAYFAIGRLLLDQIPREQMSLQSIKEYLYAHPEEVQDLLTANPSYTFFRQVAEGPLGNIEVPLTPGRSLAADRRLLPKGSLAWLETTYPPEAFPEESGVRPLRRFGFIQDTGGAIRGHGRADIFWGNGPEAERIAGPMKQTGRLFLLVAKKEVLAPEAPAVSWNRD